MSLSLAFLVIAAGVLVGLLSALFGVGGGILMVPFIVLALDKGQHVAEGTSLLVILPTAIAGVLAHRKRDFVSFRIAAWLALGGIGGGYLGAHLALDLPAGTLKLIFGGVVATIGVRTIYRGIEQFRSDKDTASQPAPDRLEQVPQGGDV